MNPRPPSRSDVARREVRLRRRRRLVLCAAWGAVLLAIGPFLFSGFLNFHGRCPPHFKFDISDGKVGFLWFWMKASGKEWYIRFSPNTGWYFDWPPWRWRYYNDHIWCEVVTPSWVGIPPTLLLALVLTLRARRHRRRINHCTACGYNLTGNVSGICPECGTPARSKADAGADR